MSTRSTDSESAPGSVAAGVRALLDELTPGLVVGIGPVPPAAAEAFAARGGECAVLAPGSVDPERLRALIGERELRAVVAVGVLDRADAPAALLGALWPVVHEHGALLVLCAANAASDVAAVRLLFGQLAADGFSGGSRFTAERLELELRSTGFRETARRDVHPDPAEAYVRAPHPAIHPSSPIGQLVRRWRALAGEHGETSEFVRAYVADPALYRPPEPAGVDAAGDSSGEQTPPRRLTVLLRTQGRRPHGLREALLCLAAQTVDVFDVDLLVHSDDAAHVEAVRALVAEFHRTFSTRVSVVPVAEGGGRSRPLNVGLERVHADYVAFLDDDDLVSAEWVEGFLSVADGASVLRQGSAVRTIGPAPAPEAPYLVRSGLEFPFSPGFALAVHFSRNHTPICAFAVPRTLIETFGLRFDEALPVLEDWDLLLRCSQLAAVRDSGLLTSIVQLWEEGDSSRSAHSVELWHETERRVQDRFDREPLVLPAGSVQRLIADGRELDRLRDWQSEFELVHFERAAYREDAEKVRGEVYYLMHQVDALQHHLDTVYSSARWRVLEPVVRVAGLARRARRRLAPGSGS